MDHLSGVGQKENTGRKAKYVFACVFFGVIRFWEERRLKELSTRSPVIETAVCGGAAGDRKGRLMPLRNSCERGHFLLADCAGSAWLPRPGHCYWTSGTPKRGCHFVHP